ncbi:NAD(P)H-dependent glycerol-3-phosphate dehydrogenase [Georgenia sp. Z1491]|uniref:NAD(P)H-dependent glycerol-3-phosphate dehydrogenase n=1 Tax=Georgenia sp. Z1491 TaxID=3416707 RepID=UPI003CE6A940
MTTITILGAGAMGSALATPYRAQGHEVRLWGTWLDDHLLDAVEAGEPHPRTQVPVAEGTRLFRSGEIEAALDGAEYVVLAVASVGVEKVAELALSGIARARVLLLTSKGFAPDAEGRIELLPDAVRRVAAASGTPLPPIVAVGGPCKANEVAADRWTATLYAGKDEAVVREVAAALSSTTYRIEPSADEVGLEVSAPMKNVYAIALGLADGLQEAHGEPFHNLKAATFAQAVREIALLGQALGGRAETVYGLAGVGDLEVTGLSGRNKVYGSRIGAGEEATEALAAMEAAEQTVEGVPAAGLAVRLARQVGGGLTERMPLLSAVADVIDGADDPAGRVAAAVLP